MGSIIWLVLVAAFVLLSGLGGSSLSLTDLLLQLKKS